MDLTPMHPTLVGGVSAIVAHAAYPDEDSSEHDDAFDNIQITAKDVRSPPDPAPGLGDGALIDEKGGDLDKENSDYSTHELGLGAAILAVPLIVMKSPTGEVKPSPVCPSMHGQRAPARRGHYGMATRAMSVLTSIERAPDTIDRIRPVKRRCDDAMQSAKAFDFFEGKQMRHF